MRKTFLMMAIYAMCCSVSHAQEMKEVFIQMPDSLSGLLTGVNRADCVDFLASDMKAEVTNRYDRRSEMTRLTEDYLFVQATPQVTWEMKLLPMNDSTKLVCFVRSVYAPVCDSEVSFYTTDWRPLKPENYLTLPTADSFFLSTDSVQSDSLTALREEADITLLKASLSPDDLSLSYEYTTLDYVRKETAGKLQRYMRKSPIRYEWSEERFVLKEP